MNKGAMLFHMLRRADGRFGVQVCAALDFYAKYQGKTATMRDFENMAIATANAGGEAGTRGPEPARGIFRAIG